MGGNCIEKDIPAHLYRRPRQVITVFYTLDAGAGEDDDEDEEGKKKGKKKGKGKGGDESGEEEEEEDDGKTKKKKKKGGRGDEDEEEEGGDGKDGAKGKKGKKGKRQSEVDMDNIVPFDMKGKLVNSSICFMLFNFFCAHLTSLDRTLLWTSV